MPYGCLLALFYGDVPSKRQTSGYGHAVEAKESGKNSRTSMPAGLRIWSAVAAPPEKYRFSCTEDSPVWWPVRIMRAGKPPRAWKKRPASQALISLPPGKCPVSRTRPTPANPGQPRTTRTGYSSIAAARERARPEAEPPGCLVSNAQGRIPDVSGWLRVKTEIFVGFRRERCEEPLLSFMD